MALEGRVDMLEAIFGKAQKPGAESKPMTAESFRSFVRDHNKRIGQRRRRSGVASAEGG